MTTLLGALTAVFITLTLAPYAMDLRSYLTHDDRPAVAIHHQEILTPNIPIGGTLIYSSWYSKRSECHPPQGEGEVAYRLISKSSDAQSVIYEFDMRRSAKWLPGDGKVDSRIDVPRDVPPGTYRFEQVSTYVCAGSSRPQVIRSPQLQVTIGG